VRTPRPGDRESTSLILIVPGMVTGSELAGFERHHALRQAHGIVAVMRDVDGWPLNAWGHLSEELIERVLRLPIQGRKRFIEQQN